MPAPTGASGPDAAMMAAPETLARFLETADEGVLRGLFSTGEVTILENFPPHVFTGQDGLEHWRGLMARHVGAISDLRHTFGPPQDFVGPATRSISPCPPAGPACATASRSTSMAAGRSCWCWRAGLADPVVWLVGDELRPVAARLSRDEPSTHGA
jgi:hypothetical protein